ncbi:hypothetical protein MHBO_000901 [Bonamia ostreae]|uniref:Uncharacterized protein n=1 Tax=Bonamia ostreae TaxID=126728 RepID=A0ABV2AH46_9EUKA
MMIGHPYGLEMKISLKGNVILEFGNLFSCDLDSFVGNSGSLVANAENLNIEGILVRGNDDFFWNKSRKCAQIKRYEKGQEIVMKPTTFDHVLQNTIFLKPHGKVVVPYQLDNRKFKEFVYFYVVNPENEKKHFLLQISKDSYEFASFNFAYESKNVPESFLNKKKFVIKYLNINLSLQLFDVTNVYCRYRKNRNQ